jgi:hypothetical protein
MDTISESNVDIDEMMRLPFEIYPNPFNESAKIQMQPCKDCSIILFDISGHPVKIWRTDKNLITKGDLSVGIYFAVLKSSSLISLPVKIVVLD